MYGDAYYQWIQSGSTTASAATSHGLFGTYNGLSMLNASGVVNIQILPSTNNLELLRSSALDSGFLFQTGGSIFYDLPPLSVNDARNLHFRNQTGASNATVRWNIWSRI